MQQAGKADLRGNQDRLLLKMKASLAQRLPDTWDMPAVTSFLTSLGDAVAAAWVRPTCLLPQA